MTVRRAVTAQDFHDECGWGKGRSVRRAFVERSERRNVGTPRVERNDGRLAALSAKEMEPTGRKGLAAGGRGLRNEGRVPTHASIRER